MGARRSTGISHRSPGLAVVPCRHSVDISSLPGYLQEQWPREVKGQAVRADLSVSCVERRGARPYSRTASGPWQVLGGRRGGCGPGRRGRGLDWLSREEVGSEDVGSDDADLEVEASRLSEVRRPRSGLPCPGCPSQ